MEQRKQLEKEFHDSLRLEHGDTHVKDTRWTPALEETIKSNPMWVNMKYYSIERKSREMVLEWFRNHCKDRRVLDYCCGNGEDGVYIALQGAREVVGLDLSDVSIKNCENLAKSNGVADKTRYLIADAEDTKFEDNSFDVITEYGALHHLDNDKAFKELARILKPEGKLICNEALGHNVAIHLYRKMTPRLRTEWEVNHIIKKKDLKVAARYFDHVELHFYHLATLLAVPFRKTRWFESMLSVLEKIDGLLMKIPFVKWQAWQLVFVLSGPKKSVR